LFKIIHISDLHIAADNGTHNWRATERILEEVVARGFDHLIITGDLVQEPTFRDFMLARKILTDFGLMNSNTLSLTIGNHEIFGGVHLAREIMGFPDKCRATDYDRRVADLRDYFPEAFENIITVEPSDIYPNAKIIDDYAIIALNSIARYSLVKNPLASRGYISPDSMTRLKALLRRPEVAGKHKIVIMHHHFCKRPFAVRLEENSIWRWVEWRSLKLRRPKKLISLLKENDIMAVLHGHAHENARYERGGVSFVNAGGSIDNPSGPHPVINELYLEGNRLEQRFAAIAFGETHKVARKFNFEMLPEFAD